jgi:hypothetical protein
MTADTPSADLDRLDDDGAPRAGVATAMIEPRLGFGVFSAVAVVLTAIIAGVAAVVALVAVVPILLFCCAAAGAVACARFSSPWVRRAPRVVDAAEPPDARLPVITLVARSAESIRSA